MSLKTWEEEFYPEPPNIGMSEYEALNHSIKKWTGLSAKNLDKHDLRIKSSRLFENFGEYALSIDSSTCALCTLHRDEDNFVNCRQCVLEIHKPGTCGECTLDNYVETTEEHKYWTIEKAPYVLFQQSGKTKPMLKALIETREVIENEKI